MPQTQTKKQPFFSIIIPVRNEARRLRYCLPSLLQQSKVDFEIIIVEDPETSDDSAEYIKLLKDARIKYIVHKPGLRVPAKRNIGASKATGKYLYFIDADMEFPQGVLLSLRDQIKSSRAELVFVAERTPGKDWLSKMKDFEKQIIQKYTCFTAARIYEAGLFGSSGGYEEDLVANEEMEISDRLISRGHSHAISEVEIYHYETSGHDLWSHFKKKFKYGTTVSDYYEKREKVESAAKRTGFSRLVYFTSPLVRQNLWKGVQFIVFKFTELSILTFGIIYGKIFNQKAVTTK